MKEVTSILDYNPESIFGADQQGLQVILSKDKFFVVNSNLISYFSPGLSEEHYYRLYESADSTLKKEAYKYLEIQDNDQMTQLNPITMENEEEGINKNIHLANDLSFLCLTNNTDELKYLGVSSEGKIMKINPNLYTHLFVNHKFVLGFSQGVDIKVIKNYQTALFANLYPDYPQQSHPAGGRSFYEARKYIFYLVTGESYSTALKCLYLQSPSKQD